MKIININKSVMILIIIFISTIINGQEKSFSFDEIMSSKKVTSYETHYFKNRDSLDIAYYSFSPDKPVAKIIFIHGGGACSKLGYFNFAQELKEKYNIEAILIDLVGHGKSEGRRGDCSSIESVYEDVKQLVNIINKDGKPLYLGGHSSGAGLVLNYSSWDERTNFQGYIFISPEFGYKSKTKRKGRVEFAKIKVGKFILNGFSGGRSHQHTYAVKFNYPKEILKVEPLIVSELTVNMSNALTPLKPQKQFSEIKEPIAMFIGENDELFDPENVIKYKEYQENKNIKSTSKIIKDQNHLSILLNIGNQIGETILYWNE